MRLGSLTLAAGAAALPFLAPPRSAWPSPQQVPPSNPTPGSPLPLLPAYAATADSNGDMIAVTGVDRMGESILYLVDTKRRQLAVYQASGGGRASRAVRLVGARRIDLDLQLYGYNDGSEYPYRELEKLFRKREGAALPAAPGIDVGEAPAAPR